MVCRHCLVPIALIEVSRSANRRDKKARSQQWDLAEYCATSTALDVLKNDYGTYRVPGTGYQTVVSQRSAAAAGYVCRCRLQKRMEEGKGGAGGRREGGYKREEGKEGWAEEGGGRGTSEETP